MQADGLFLLGPLQPGGRHHRWVLRTHPEGTCRAWVAGRLFHQPEAGLPALVAGLIPTTMPPGPGWVTGTFVGYADEADLARGLADLDALAAEGGGEARLLPVLLEGGATYVAWAWALDPDHLDRLAREAVELPEGDWGPYL
jgi:hypothetical protein